MEQDEHRQHDDHEVYGGEIPDEGEMDADFRVEEEEEGAGDHHGPNNPNKVPPNLCLSALSPLSISFSFCLL